MKKIGSIFFFGFIIIASLSFGYYMKKERISLNDVKKQGIETSALITKITRKTVGKLDLNAQFFIDVKWQDKMGAELSHANLQVFGQSLLHVKRLYNEIMHNRKVKQKGAGFHTEEIFFKTHSQR